MEGHDKQNPNPGQATDLSKAQSPQQPRSRLQGQPPEGKAGQQAEGQAQQSEFGQSQQQPSGDFEGPTGQRAGASDTLSEQRADIKGGTSTGQATDIEGSSTFVGSQSDSDSSSLLIEDDDFIDDPRGDGE